MTGFHGWKARALWADIKFGVKHLADIDRLAIVGDKRWHQGLTTFCKPFTKATIQYFDQTDTTAAQQWLGESQNGG